MAGGIAHDFNNYLTVINGCTDLLKLKIDKNDHMFRLLEEISKSEKRAESLTRQLLLFSRKEIQEPKVLEMGNIVVGIENMLNRLIGDNIELLLDVIPGHDYFYSDRGQIEQVLMNLVINSRDAMHDGGKIFIKSQSVEIKEPVFWEDNETKPGWYIMISVSDTGIGMTKEVIARIFEPCYTTKRAGKGTGLGLSNTGEVFLL